MSEAVPAAAELDPTRGRTVRKLIWYGLVIATVAVCATAPLRDANLSFYFSFMMFATLATGINFIAGFAGYMPFGYVAFYGVGAYATGIAIRSLDLSPFLAVPFAGVVGVGLGLLFAPTLRISGFYFAIVSLSLAVICQRIVALMPEEITGGALGINIGVVTERVNGYYVMVAVLTAALLTASWLADSRLGKALKAIRDDAGAADAMGVNVVRVRLKAWLMAAGFASLAGGTQAWFTGAFDSQTAFDVLITAKTVIYAMAGGLGTVLGPVIGTIVLVGIDEAIWRSFPVMNNFLLGLVIVLLILFAPRGMVGTLLRRYPRLRGYVM